MCTALMTEHCLLANIPIFIPMDFGNVPPGPNSLLILLVIIWLCCSGVIACIFHEDAEKFRGRHVVGAILGPLVMLYWLGRGILAALARGW